MTALGDKKKRPFGRVEIEQAPTRKLRASPSFLEQAAGGNPDLLAIVKVAQPGYVPASVELRERIEPTLFTALIPAGLLKQTLDDELVVLVEPSTLLSPTKR